MIKFAAACMPCQCLTVSLRAQACASNSNHDSVGIRTIATQIMLFLHVRLHVHMHCGSYYLPVLSLSQLYPVSNGYLVTRKHV